MSTSGMTSRITSGEEAFAQPAHRLAAWGTLNAEHSVWCVDTCRSQPAACSNVFPQHTILPCGSGPPLCCSAPLLQQCNQCLPMQQHVLANGEDRSQKVEPGSLAARLSSNECAGDNFCSALAQIYAKAPRRLDTAASPAPYKIRAICACFATASTHIGSLSKTALLAGGVLCCRQKFVDVLKERFASFNLAYSIGGQISFDVFPQV